MEPTIKNIRQNAIWLTPHMWCYKKIPMIIDQTLQLVWQKEKSMIN